MLGSRQVDLHSGKSEVVVGPHVREIENVGLTLQSIEQRVRAVTQSGHTKSGRSLEGSSINGWRKQNDEDTYLYALQAHTTVITWLVDDLLPIRRAVHLAFLQDLRSRGGTSKVLGLLVRLGQSGRVFASRDVLS